MDPIISKIPAALPDQTTADPNPQPAKTRASTFDQVRNRLAKNSNATQAATFAPRIADDQPAISKMQNGPMPITLSGRVQSGLAVGKHHLERLRERIDSVPSASSSSGIQGRLFSVEQQYTRLDSAVQGMSPNANPQQWIMLQQQVYSMNENITALSKLVGQSASGVKTILQTQI
jgi:hypothetical protein